MAPGRIGAGDVSQTTREGEHMGEQALPTRTQAQSKSMPRASRNRSMRIARVIALAATAVTMMAGAGTSGCAVSESDVTRWETTERGPYKLVAVVTHDKYSWQLRTDS